MQSCCYRNSFDTIVSLQRLSLHPPKKMAFEDRRYPQPCDRSQLANIKSVFKQDRVLAMFTDRLNLPIDKNRAQLQDQTLRLTGMTWDDYETITQQDFNHRASYFAGIITIVSPSLNHERIAEIINGLVKAYCRKYSLLYFPKGSATLKNDFTVGKEPDHSFNFKIEKDIPDLAIEVVFSSGGVSDLEKYKYLKVPEVWIWEDRKIKFYQLTDSKYRKIYLSNCLPELSSEFLIEFINRGLEESPLTIEADFIAQLN